MTKLFSNLRTRAAIVLTAGEGLSGTLLRSGLPAFADYTRRAIVPRVAAGLIAAALVLPLISSAQETQTNSPAQLFARALTRLVAIIEPPANQATRTFTTTLKVIKADGLPKEIEGRELDLAYQGPDHLRIGAKWDRQSYIACRDGQEVWIYAPGKKFGLIGSPDQAPFSTAPAAKDRQADWVRSSCRSQPSSLRSCLS
jgi:hypothetical protein